MSSSSGEVHSVFQSPHAQGFEGSPINQPTRDATIAFQQVNPKRAGSKGHGRYEKYKASCTHGTFRDLGGTAGDWRWDYSRGYVKILSVGNNKNKQRMRKITNEGAPQAAALSSPPSALPTPLTTNEEGISLKTRKVLFMEVCATYFLVFKC
jgi:hypothetical protein